MNKQDIRRLDMLVRADQFGTDHPLTPANARVTALLLLLKAVITQVNTLGGGQESGRGQFRGGASERLRLSVSLRKLMRKISDIAMVLDPVTYPGAREQFRMPRTETYQDLVNRAQAFVEAVGPIKSAFVERDLPVDFDEQLAGLIAEFTTATQLKASGLADQVQGTAGVRAATLNGVSIVREIGAILKVRYENDPGLYAAWKSASHIERPPRSDEPVAPSGSGSPSGGTTPPGDTQLIALNANVNGNEAEANGAATLTIPSRNGVMLA